MWQTTMHCVTVKNVEGIQSNSETTEEGASDSVSIDMRELHDDQTQGHPHPDSRES